VEAWETDRSPDGIRQLSGSWSGQGRCPDWRV